MQFIHNFLGKNGFYWFVGVIEDRNDPLKNGRYRVRCFGWNFPDKVEEPTDDLLWATCMLPTTSAGKSGLGESTSLVEGTWVLGFFVDGIEAQEPIILGSLKGIPQFAADPSVGFNDPRTSFEGFPFSIADIQYNSDGSGTSHTNADASSFPRQIDEPDTSRTARNDPEYVPHHIQYKEASRNAGNVDVETAGFAGSGGTSLSVASGVFSEPENPYSAKYPFNRVIETESGHLLEFDDTPEGERIHLYHRTGSFIEIHPDGSVVAKAVNDQYDLVQKNRYEQTQGDKAETIQGSARLSVGNRSGDFTLQVNNGNLNVESSENTNVNVGGDANVNVEGSVNIASEDVTHTVTGSYTLNVSGLVTISGSQVDILGTPINLN